MSGRKAVVKMFSSLLSILKLTEMNLVIDCVESQNRKQTLRCIIEYQQLCC